ncbi:hypothetical protein [Arthrobacter sp. Br18]|uniref:hypothetical protein n=1 Tax=Arthrobacter sp. Br18 TaxID=1312954 RepID=UPI00047D4171|nr:hypothetical protein [Arthrobacter sp. Br18]
MVLFGGWAVPEVLAEEFRELLRKLIHIAHEPANLRDALVSGVELQVARQLLVTPSIEHPVEGLLFGMK